MKPGCEKIQEATAKKSFGLRPLKSSQPQQGPFVQVVEFPDVEGACEFSYDEEWLGILRATHHLMSLKRQQVALPGKLGLREL